MSSPAVTNFDNVDGKMTFDMENVDVSVATVYEGNLIHIETLDFLEFPHEEVPHITKTILNSQRIFEAKNLCIPVHQGWKSWSSIKKIKQVQCAILENYEIFVNGSIYNEQGLHYH